MRELQGGDFLTGAATGAFSSLAGAVLSAAGANTNDITRAAITIAGGGVVGGLTESAMGGTFWNVSDNVKPSEFGFAQSETE